MLSATLGAALGGVLAAFAVLVRGGAVMVHQCVAADGAAGWLGLRLALLRVDGDCPTGALAIGGDGRQVMGVVAMVALPVLLAHLGGLGVGVALLALLARVLRGAADALRHVGPRVLAPAPVPATPRSAPAVASFHAVVSALTTTSLRRRGPPVALPV